MDHTEKIKTAFARNVQALTKNPSMGLKTGHVKATMRDGLTCDIESGPWKMTVDMPEKTGGNETGPTPGILEAGALGSCLLIMTGLFAAKLDVPIDHVEVNVEFDSDSRVLFQVGDVPSRWRAIRYEILVESPAPEVDVRRVLDLAHRQSHVRGDLEHAFQIERKVNILPTKEVADMPGNDGA